MPGRGGAMNGARPPVVINDEPFPAPLEPRVSLLDYIRDQACLTGTHGGCEQGACGACTVLLDGRAVRSCLILAVSAAGRRVTTIEGLARGGELHPLQRALIRHHGLQCGFCTPGVVMNAIDLLARQTGALTEADVREAMSGNLCRCTGYGGIVAAVVEISGRAG